jgi:hypothetical protein
MTRLWLDHGSTTSWLVEVLFATVATRPEVPMSPRSTIDPRRAAWATAVVTAIGVTIAAATLTASADGGAPHTHPAGLLTDRNREITACSDAETGEARLSLDDPVFRLPW